MDAQFLKEIVLRSEGYAQGFRDGFAACARTIAEEETRKQFEQKSKEEGK